MKEVNEERIAPIVVVVELTQNELLRAMKSATHDEVACEKASSAAMTGVGEAAVFTLAEKLQAAYRSSGQKPRSDDRCTCSHTRHWHGQTAGGSTAGSGECEFSASCNCQRFEMTVA